MAAVWGHRSTGPESSLGAGGPWRAEALEVGQGGLSSGGESEGTEGRDGNTQERITSPLSLPSSSPSLHCYHPSGQSQRELGEGTQGRRCVLQEEEQGGK